MGAGSTREKILEAAGEILARDGIEGFTTTAVAEEADVSHGLVHHYFETKDGLLRRLFEWGWEKADRHIDELAPTDDPRDRLVTFSGYLIEPEEQLEERLSVARIDLELRARAVHDDRLQSIFERGRAEMVGIASDIVRDGIDRGRFRPVDVDRFAAAFVSAVVGAEQLFAIHGGSEPSRAILQGLAELVDACLVAPDAPHEPGGSG